MADDNLERITILLQARDKDLARSMDRMNRQIARFTRDSERNTAQMQQRVEGHFERMGQSALGFGRTLAAGLAAGAATAALGILTNNLRGTVRSIASVGDEARRAGLGVEEFQQWAFVAEQNRISVDALVDGFKELNLRADEFIVTGAGPAAEAFQRLGFDAQSLRAALQDPSELMLEMIDRMQGLDRAAQIRVADEAFGGTAGERFVELLSQGEDGLRALMDRSREVGAVIDEQMIARFVEIDRRLSEITTRFVNLAKEAIDGWGIIVNSVIDLVTTDEAEQAVEDLRQAYIQLEGDARDTQSVLQYLADTAARLGDDRWSQALGQLASATDTVTDAFHDGTISGDDFRRLLEQLAGGADTAMGAIQSIDDVTLDNAAEVVQALRDRLSSLAQQANVTAAAVSEAVQMDRGTPLANVVLPQDMLGGRRASAPPRAPNEGSAAYNAGSSGSGGGSDGYRGAVEDIQARTRALEIEAAALVAAAGSNQEYGAAIEYARTRAQLMNDATAEGRALTPALQAEIDRLAEAYVTAGQNAEEAADRMRQVQEDAERGADAIGSIFDGIVQGGDAARQAIARLLQQMASNAFQRLLMGMTGSGGGGILSMIGGLLGGKRAGGGGFGGFFADGGSLGAGQWGIAGEAGPEIVHGPATITPMDRGAGGRRSAPVINFSVDARGAQRGVAEEIEAKLRQMTPEIVRQSVTATRASVREYPL